MVDSGNHSSIEDIVCYQEVTGGSYWKVCPKSLAHLEIMNRTAVIFETVFMAFQIFIKQTENLINVCVFVDHIMESICSKNTDEIHLRIWK